ncbi:MAG: LicD family protein, partial [Dysgonamonadaceae bacterium]|nr:LicD family protein [Dysgonamonadaceae bacterium]
MASYDIRPLQLRILDILLAFDQLCKEHHIRYYILAGTQLGAVRHQGFIPWDDDADIGVPRADYERLIANISQQLPSPYEFLCGENNPEYPFPYAKIQDASTSMIERKEDAFFGG